MKPHNHPYDEQLWNQLSDRLDSHYNTSKKRRVALWWIFGSLGVLLIVGGLGYFLQEEPNKAYSATELVDKVNDGDEESALNKATESKKNGADETNNASAVNTSISKAVRKEKNNEILPIKGVENGSEMSTGNHSAPLVSGYSPRYLQKKQNSLALLS